MNANRSWNRHAITLVCGSISMVSGMAAAQATIGMIPGTIGPEPVLYHECQACHPEVEGLCDTRKCAAENDDGDTYCGCTGLAGWTDDPNPRPTILAECHYKEGGCAQ